jgi:hypothetical protein
MRLLLAILFSSALVWTGDSHAEMAIAIGTTGNVNKDGFVWGGGFDEGARQTALDICRGLKVPDVGKLPKNVPKVKKLCKIVVVFSDKCFAIAHDGSTTKPGNGFGWVVEDTLRAAEAGAIAKCEDEVGRARGAACKVEYSHCDGTAK